MRKTTLRRKTMGQNAITQGHGRVEWKHGRVAKSETILV